MPKTPKYSERINFFFVVNGKDIPFKQEINILNKLRPNCVMSGGVDGALLKAHSLSTNTIFRDSKSLSEDDADPDQLHLIRECFIELFKYAFTLVDKNSEFDRVVDGKYLYVQMEKTMNKIHNHLQKLDKTWLQNYGTVCFENLKFQNPEDLLELIPVAENVFGRMFKETGQTLAKAEKSIRANAVLDRNRANVAETPYH